MNIQEVAEMKRPGISPRQRAWRKGFGEGAEYIIDKAIKWLFEHREEVQTEDNGITGWIPDELIMDFKQAMTE